MFVKLKKKKTCIKFSLFLVCVHIFRPCHNGQCVKISTVCDTERNCVDKSDELCKLPNAIVKDFQNGLSNKLLINIFCYLETVQIVIINIKMFVWGFVSQLNYSLTKNRVAYQKMRRTHSSLAMNTEMETVILHWIP